MKIFRVFFFAVVISIVGFVTSFSGVLSTNPAFAAVDNDFGTLLVESSSAGISIEWVTEPDVNLEVTVGGKLVVESGESGTVTLAPIPQGDRADFQLTWTRPVSNSSELPADISNQVIAIAEATTESFNEIQINGFQLGRYAEIQVDSAFATVLPSLTTFKYLTFIDAPFVAVPLFGCSISNPGDKWFKGDNRGYDDSTPDFRTKIVVRVDWTIGGSISYNRLVHATNVYRKLSNGSMVFVSDSLASNAGISVTKYQESNTLSHFRIKHDVSNPYCAFANSIYYDYRVYVARSGNYTMTGFNYDIPSHEAYIIDDDQAAWESIYQSFGDNFSTCLPAPTRGLCEQDVTESGAR